MKKFDVKVTVSQWVKRETEIDLYDIEAPNEGAFQDEVQEAAMEAINDGVDDWEIVEENDFEVEETKTYN